MKSKIAFIGSGDLARQIFNYINEDESYSFVGCFDDFCSKGTNELGLNIIGRTSEIEKFYFNKIFDQLLIAVGYSRLDYKGEMFKKFQKKIPFATYIHPTVFASKSAKISNGTIVFPNCTIDQNVIINENVFLHINVSVAHDSNIGEHSFLSPRVALAGFVRVGSFCNLGINTSVKDNISVVDNVRTGAGTVVVKDITEAGTYVGVPARKIK